MFLKIEIYFIIIIIYKFIYSKDYICNINSFFIFLFLLKSEVKYLKGFIQILYILYIMMDDIVIIFLDFVDMSVIVMEVIRRQVLVDFMIFFNINGVMKFV